MCRQALRGIVEWALKTAMLNSAAVQAKTLACLLYCGALLGIVEWALMTAMLNSAAVKANVLACLIYCGHMFVLLWRLSDAVSVLGGG